MAIIQQVIITLSLFYYTCIPFSCASLSDAKCSCNRVICACLCALSSRTFDSASLSASRSRILANARCMSCSKSSIFLEFSAFSASHSLNRTICLISCHFCNVLLLTISPFVAVAQCFPIHWYVWNHFGCQHSFVAVVMLVSCTVHSRYVFLAAEMSIVVLWFPIMNYSVSTYHTTSTCASHLPVAWFVIHTKLSDYSALIQAFQHHLIETCLE